MSYKPETAIWSRDTGQRMFFKCQLNIVSWTKLFWIDVFQQEKQNKQSDTNNFVIVLNLTTQY